MLWGDSYTTHYTDKIDATVSTNIPDVTKQTADHQSVLNTYLIFTALRNTYPALAQGTMTRHALFNESGEGEKKYKSIVAWYMTKDSEKLLVIHNFGNSEIEIPYRRIRKCTGEGRPWKLLFKTRRICLRCLSSKKLIYENT